MLVAAQVNDLKITDFRQQPYSAFRLLLSGQLDKWYYEDNVDSRFTIIPYYHMFSDTRDYAVSAQVGGSYEYKTTIIALSILLEARNYLFAWPFFLHEKLSFSSWSRRDSQDQNSGWENLKQGSLELGAGFGHLREGHFTVWALYINDILLQHNVIDENLSDKTVSGIAETLSKITYFSVRHDRKEKYVLKEIEALLEADPALIRPIPILTWFEIFEVIEGFPFYTVRWRTGYWRRMFGARFSFHFRAHDISEYSYHFTKKEFPLFDSVYYTPSTQLKFEYEKPLDLRKQLSMSSFYTTTWHDSVTRHEIGAGFEYAYGVIDFFLIRGLIGLSYIYDYRPSTESNYHLIAEPEIEFSYYVEDAIEVWLNGACRFDKQEGYDFSANPYVTIGADYRIF